MRTTDQQLDLLALCKVKGLNWYLIAREAQRPGGLERLWRADPLEASADAVKARALLAEVDEPARDDLRAQAQAELDKVQGEDVRLLTVLDDAFPQNLRLVPNAPPFLFTRGTMTDADLRSVAVVGTRAASDTGRTRAERMARELVERGVTVVSGLAHGIDTAAHTAALDAGGRTIAVIGTGINRCYPAANRALGDRIADGAGALVSQFWPDAPGATWSFPRRNITMSGIAQGTVVIEASSTSGAKMQARIALEHGKKVFLIKSLTEQQEWARKYVQDRGAVQVEDVRTVADALAPPEHIQAVDNLRSQLVLDFA